MNNNTPSETQHAMSGEALARVARSQTNLFSFFSVVIIMTIIFFNFIIWCMLYQENPELSILTLTTICILVATFRMFHSLIGSLLACDPPPISKRIAVLSHVLALIPVVNFILLFTLDQVCSKLLSSYQIPENRSNGIQRVLSMAAFLCLIAAVLTIIISIFSNLGSHYITAPLYT